MNRNIPISRVTSEPAVEPVSIADIKRQAFIPLDVSHHDIDLITYRKAARRMVEQLTNRSLITQTRAQYYDCLEEVMHIRFSPVQSVSSITYKDTVEATQTLTSTLYTVDTQSIPARIIAGYDDTYPTAIVDTNSVTVTAICGYGAAAESVPDLFKLAIRYAAAEMFARRDVADYIDTLRMMLAIEGSTVEYA